MASLTNPPSCDDKRLWDVMMSAYHMPLLSAADELGIFSFLADQPATAAHIARHFSLAERSVHAMLGVLSSLGFLSQHSGQFSITEISRTYLLPDSRFYWGPLLRLARDPVMSFTMVMQNLKDGGDAITRLDGQDMWETHALDQARAEQFTQAMHSHSMAPAMGVARCGDFNGVQRLLDVGGASACFPIALAARYPEMRFTVLDLPFICGLTRDYIDDAGLSARIDTVAAEMFKDPWPTDHDAIFFSNIFHDWDVERCQQLADKAFNSLPSGGRIYIHEILLSDTADSPLTPISYSMDMAFYTAGKQYSALELKHILSKAGFQNMGVTHTHGYFSLVTAQKS